VKLGHYRARANVSVLSLTVSNLPNLSDLSNLVFVRKFSWRFSLFSLSL